VKLLDKKFIYIVSFAIIFSAIFNYLNLEREASLSFVILFVIIAILYKYLFTGHFYWPKAGKSVIYFLIITLFLFTYISQNVFLNFETLDWDIPSYLVASQEVKNGYLPNETQWESKGPLLFYFYNIFLLISSKNFVIFKLLNDLILFFISVILFFTIYRSTNNDYVKSFFSSLLFLLLMSQSWAVSEYSETFCLFFIAIANYLILKVKMTNTNLFLIGLVMSFSTLINQGTFLFVIPLIIFLYKNIEITRLIKSLSIFAIGLLFPHLIFVIIYASQNLLKIYFATYIQIPLGYIESNYANFYELRVFFRSFHENIETLYFVLIVIIFFLLIQTFNKVGDFKKLFFDIKYLNVLICFLFYFVGSHNYYHHLIFLMYFLPIMLLEINVNSQNLLIYSLLTISSFVFLQQNFEKSFNNISNPNKTFSEYPLRSLATEIDTYFEEDDYTILALDYLLVPFYLDKQNYTYIVHPSNHFEKFIVETLSDLGVIDSNYIESILLYEEPDVIMCSQRMIIRGSPTQNPLYNCAVDDYRKNYRQLDTSKYVKNANFNFYKDPYKELNVYIKEK
tara:strand:+ start:92 stop:1786 length:1695 start_codon:yes stop_codon:yes gene_type:complete